MKTLLRVALLLGLVVAVNAAIESSRECQCDESCWCKTSWGSHLRWLVPAGHKTK